MWPFKKKTEQRNSLIIEELLSYMGVANTGAGEFVTPTTAESLPAVMNAVTVIAEAVASMPCYLYQLKQDGRERVFDHPVDFLLNEMPSRSQTPYQFKYTMMRHCLLTGNAYAVIEWDKTGQPVSLTPYQPSAVNIFINPKGDYIYQITDLNGKVKNYLQDEILHLRHSSLDGFMGRSPIAICRETVGLGIAQQKHGASVMKNGLMASGLITTSEWLDEAKAQKAIKALERYKGAKNAGKTPVLEGSMEYKQL
ncbi:Portal protein (GP3), partial [Pasteurella multocida subsp. multocida str. Anand1_buffalo]